MNDDQRKNHCYLGDAVYAEFDGYGIWLRTGHHLDEKCNDKIYLEPNVLHKLNEFVKYLKEISGE